MNLNHHAHLLTRIARLMLLSLFCALTPQVARAATISVDTVDYGVVVDGDCSLVEAILAANSNTSNDCPAGDDTPVDTIVLGSNITYTLPMSYATYLGPTGLPSITSAIVISGNNSTIARDSVEQFGLMHVSAVTGTLTLHDLTLWNGDTPASGGAIANEGTLTVINSEVISNISWQSGGGLYNSGGTLTLINSEVISNTSWQSGGGIYNSSGTLTIINSILRSNLDNEYGSGLANFNDGRATLVGSRVESNHKFGEGSDLGLWGGYGGGIGNVNSSLILTDTYVVSNSIGYRGGGIVSEGISATLRLDNSYVLYNRTTLGYPHEENYGGGIAVISGTALISNTQVAFNKSHYGGGISVQQSTLTLINSDIRSNDTYDRGGSISVAGKGGGVYSEGSMTTLINSRLVSNFAATHGGGIANLDGAVFITNSHILTNTAIGSGPAEPPSAGGGIYNALNSVLIIADSHVVANTARYDSGGGIDNKGTMTVTQSYIVSNTGRLGGGIGNSHGLATLTIRDSHILSNTNIEDDFGVSYGAAIYNQGTASITNTAIIANVSSGSIIANLSAASLTILNSRILNNRGTIQGSTSFTINQSCIVGNSDPAVSGQSGAPLDARNNWWGAPDGPSGVASGSGDSVSKGVSFTPFLTSAPVGCPSLAADFAFEMRSQPVTTLMPGQSVSHTVIITNTGDAKINNLSLTTANFNGESQSEEINLLPDEVISRVYHPAVNPTLTANRVVTFTAEVSHELAPTQSDSASYNVVVPRLTWSSATYSVDEEVGQFTATVVLSPTNPYGTVTVQAQISDTVAQNFNSAEISFPPNSSSQTVGFAIEEDNVVPRQIQLVLQNPAGAGLGNPSKATLNVDGDGGEGDNFPLSVRANKQDAVVGESILYTYRITNTGELTLTVSNAIDNRAGVLAGLIGTLAPGATRTTTASYVVKAEDASPLVNEVVVTASDVHGNDSIFNATTSVIIADEFTVTFPMIRLQD